MVSNINIYYIIVIGIAFFISFISTPLMRVIAMRFKIYDHPHSLVKTHTIPVPYLGGIAIWFGFVFSLLIIRLITQFPSGTLHNLRAILLGGLSIVILGIIDDLNPKGIDFKKKFIFQFVSVLVLIFFGIHIKFIEPSYVAIILTIIWVVGISNAFNIIDIIDGLAASIAIIASLAFVIIALPTEQIYVNFAGMALAGACLGFLPYNLSKKMRIFMGDTGSLFIGFILASIALGTSYTNVN
ncbi:MAG: MraY family glycosyltransferase, partial [bacterium]